MTTTCILRLLTVCAVGYALWAAWYLFRESRRSNRRLPVSDAAPRRREIIGKSRFVLDRRRSLPQAAVAAKTEKGIEKEPIFAPASAPEHPRQIPPEDLDEVFGEVPAGEQNEPLDIYYPAGGTIGNPRPAMILKTPPNMDNAKAFVDYLFSDEAQQLVANAYLLPGRTDIKCDKRSNLEDIPQITPDWDKMMAEASDDAAKINQICGASNG